MKIEGVEEVQFVNTCPLIEQANGWDWDNSGGEKARNKFYQKHTPHTGVEIIYNDGSTESVDLGNPDKQNEVRTNIRNWELKIHAAHIGFGLVPIPYFIHGVPRFLEAAFNNDTPQAWLRLAEMIPAVIWELADLADWGARLDGPKLTARKYSQALNEVVGKNIRTKLKLVSS